MNPTGITTPVVAPNIFDPESLVGDLQDIKKSAVTSLLESFGLLGNFAISGASNAAQSNGLQDLEAPTLTRNVNDITLRIGLLQDALNQLLAQTSRTEIQQRMNDLQKENQKQLERFQEQMEKAAEAAEKNKEAQKKGNIFEAVTNWIQAVVSIVSAVFTLITAVGQILTNPVGAAGLIVAGVALIGMAAVQITLAVDATMRATGKEGFLSDDDKTKMKKAIEIMGYIALAGAMIGLVGGVLVALGQAGKAAAQVGAQQGGRWAATKIMVRGSDQAIKAAAKEAFKESMKPLNRLSIQLGIARGIVGGSADVGTAVGKLEVAKLKQDASDFQAEADQAEAAAKALQAQIAKLRALIEQLQDELESMIEQGQQTMAVIFGAIDESASSMTRIQQTASA